MRSARAPARQLVARGSVRGWYVNVQRAKRRAPGVADLVYLATLHEQHRPRFERIAAAIDDGDTRSGHHEEPLVAAAVIVVGSALAVARRDHHFGRLRAAVAERNSKTVSEPQLLALHLLHRLRIDIESPALSPPSPRRDHRHERANEEQRGGDTRA